MSRGGGRGGRGGGRGGGPGFVIPAHSTMSKQEWAEALKEAPPKNIGMLFPPLDPKSLSTLNAPGPQEDNLLTLSHHLQNHIQTGSPYIGQRTATPWRMTGERKVVGIEIETWSASRAQTSTQTHTPITPENMYLQQNMFPPRLWEQVFEGRDLSDAQKKKRADKERERKRRRLDATEKDDEEPSDEDDEKAKSALGSDEEQGDFDDEDEEEDHQDYDANYFDNGEGDDDDDGGEGGGGGDDAWD